MIRFTAEKQEIINTSEWLCLYKGDEPVCLVQWNALHSEGYKEEAHVIKADLNCIGVLVNLSKVCSVGNKFIS